MGEYGTVLENLLGSGGGSFFNFDSVLGVALIFISGAALYSWISNKRSLGGKHSLFSRTIFIFIFKKFMTYIKEGSNE